MIRYTQGEGTVPRAYTKVGKKVSEGKFGIQATLILGKGMSETEPRTTPQITKRIVDELVTRQDPERVVAFYMTVWKKKGIVKQHEIGDPLPPAEPAEPTANVEEIVGNEAPATESTEMTDAEANEAEAEAESEPAVLPDLSGMKLSEAVLAVMKYRGSQVNTAADVVGTLNANGYEFKINQVQSALQALQNKNLVKRDGDEFSLASA